MVTSLLFDYYVDSVPMMHAWQDTLEVRSKKARKMDTSATEVRCEYPVHATFSHLSPDLSTVAIATLLLDSDIAGR